MKLRDILKGIEYTTKDEDLLDKEIKDIKIDHRNVEDGDLYIAMRGRTFDGNIFVEEAVRNGACVVINDVNLFFREGVRVKNAREAYALMCKNFFGSACDKLKLVAVTGTNGKTTTCNTISDILQMAGKRVGVIGTLGAKYAGKVVDTGFTTPDPYILHSLFQKMKKEGVEYVIMETSAHALELNKLDGLTFEVGVLTNITEDHLDYFYDMDSYAKAKFKLFQEGKIKQGLVCSGKAYVEDLLNSTKVPIKTYGFNENSDYRCEVLDKSFNGSTFRCFMPDGQIGVKTPLVGKYNLENALASIAVCKCLGVDDWDIKKGMSCTLPVEGRFNVIRGNNCNIIVDFAHTPDGLEKVLTTAKELSKDKLVVIFGCGGNRDKQKRPIMGKIASEIADEVILTSDNPRFEKPLDIINEIKEGISKNNYKVCENRKEAIFYALKNFNRGETILIAGKGAEKYQEIRGVKYPYNDFDVICDYYKKATSREDFQEYEQENS